MAKRDYYEALGVSRGCDDKALKCAFRKLAMECHPDRNGGDTKSEHRFKEINEAYEVLKDPQKRAAYDRFGHQAFEHGGMGAGPASAFPPSLTSSTSSSATCRAERAAAAAASAGPTSATISRSRSKTPSPA